MRATIDAMPLNLDTELFVHTYFEGFGHNTRNRYGRYSQALLASLPFDHRKIDGGFCSKNGPQVEGQALLHHIEGWTVLAFWDRSGDDRGNSNTAFVVRGEHGFDDVVELTREHFPKVWARVSSTTSSKP